MILPTNLSVLGGSQIKQCRQISPFKYHSNMGQTLEVMFSQTEQTHGTRELISSTVMKRERPTYTYSNVQNWSRRIECGLFKLDNLYIPINHQNVHWLTMRVNFKAREISLWDSAGMNYTNTQYIDAALQYFG